GEGQGAQGVHPLPRHRRAEAPQGPRLRAAAQGARRQDDPAARQDQGPVMLDLRGRRAYADRAFRYAAVGAAALGLLILGLIAITMTRRALPVFGTMGLSFFTETRWSAPDEVFGALPFIFGTLFTAAIAVVIAVPISLGVALFITQVAPPWLKKPMVYVI